MKRNQRVAIGHITFPPMWKETLATTKHGGRVPWPTFVDFLRLHCRAATHWGMFQVVGVSEGDLLQLILKEQKFHVSHPYSILPCLGPVDHDTACPQEQGFKDQGVKRQKRDNLCMYDSYSNVVPQDNTASASSETQH